MAHEVDLRLGREARQRSRRRLAVAAAVTTVLLTAAAVPAEGAEPSNGGSVPVVGDFAVGDGLEALIDEQDGSFGVTITVGALELRWDSRSRGDRFGLGAGWGFALGFVDTVGGTRLVTPTSAEVFDADASTPSGLAGYTLEDLRFRRLEVDAAQAGPGAAPGHAEFALHELDAVSTYYSHAGDPVAARSRHGDQTTWEWDAEVPHRLERLIDAEGVQTTLDWVSEAKTLVVRAGANLGSGQGEPDRAWRVAFDEQGAIFAVTDPAGGRATFEYQDSQLTRISTPSGAQTVIEWQRFDDEVPRVRRLSTLDHAGEQLSARTWDRYGAAIPSGWPLVDGGGGAARTEAAGFRTELSDGVTSVRSEYSGERLLRSRDVVVAEAGERLLERQVAEYPSTGSPSRTPAVGTLRSRPLATTSTRFNASGASRDERTSFDYDAFGRVIRQVAADGAVTETTYDDQVPAGRELPIGLVTSRTVTTTDGLVHGEVSTLNEARTAVVAIDALDAPSTTDERTVTIRTEYDVDPKGFVSERRVHPSGDTRAAPSVTRWSEASDLSAGTSTTVETIGVGTDAEARTSTTVSLLHGGVLATTDVLGRTATTEYDELAREVAFTGLAGTTVRTAYESWQHDGRNATVVTGADGVVTTEVRDELGRVVMRTDNIDHGIAKPGHVRVVETTDHDVPGTVKVTDAWGATTSVSKDAFGREVRRTGPTGLVHVTEYDDAADRIRTGTTPTGLLVDAETVSVAALDRDTRTSRTSLSRRDGVDVPDSVETVDGLGRPTSASDGFVRTSAQYDSHGRPAAVTIARDDAAARPELTAERRFDALGNGVEKRLADGTGETSGGSRVIDDLGRTRTETDRAGRVSTFDYSIDGLLTRSTRTDGREIRNEYDPASRALTRTATESPIGEAVETAYEYEPATGRVRTVFDPRDRAATEIGYAYDAHGNLLSVRYPDGGSISYGYDLHGRRSTTTDPAGNVTAYDYDRAGALVGAVQRDANGVELARVAYELDDLGRLARVSRGNGVVTELAHTSAGEIASEITTSGDGVISERAYTYDPRGLLVERVDRVVDEHGALRGTSTRYRYDERGRLVESSVTDQQGDADGPTPQAPLIRATSYELSVAGDVTAETIRQRGDGAEPSRERHYEYSESGELSAIADDSGRVEQRYDAAGNLVSGADGAALTYDAADRPATETTPDGTVVRTSYWADGSRRSLTSTGRDGIVRSTEFRWDGDDLLGESHRVGDARTTAAYLLGSGREARTTADMNGAETGGAGTVYYGTDRHGNVTELTSADGRITERYAYGDYGAELPPGADDPAAPTCAASGLGDPGRNPFRYSGEYTDPTCRQHLGVRMYDVGTMRFTSYDTAAVMNPYGYADANPITRIDPTGYSAEDDRGGVLSPEKWAWNFATLVLSFAGLAGTGLSFLAPLKGYQIAMLVIAGLGDGISGVTAAVRWGLEHQIDAATSDRLGEFDIFAGAAIVGMGFAARAGYWYYAKREAAQQANRRLATLFGSDHTLTPKGGPDSGGERSWGGVPLAEAGEESPLVMNSRRYEEVQLPHRDRTTSESETAGTHIGESLRSKQRKTGADLLLRTQQTFGPRVRPPAVPSSPAHETPAASLTQPKAAELHVPAAVHQPQVEQPAPSPVIVDGGPKTDDLTNVLDFTSVTTHRFE